MSTDPHRIPPFDTGKVKIGLLYERKRPWTPSRDAYDLQTALLDRRPTQPLSRLLVSPLERLLSLFKRGL